MNPTNIIIEFLEDAASEEEGIDALDVFEEWFDSDEMDFEVYCLIFSGWHLAKQYPPVEVNEQLVEEVGGILLGGHYGTLH